MPGIACAFRRAHRCRMMQSHTPSLNHKRRVALLGSTGSIGTSTLDVVRHLPDRLEVAGLAAHSKWEQLADQCRAFKPRFAVLCDPVAFKQADRKSFPKETELLCGDEGVARTGDRCGRGRRRVRRGRRGRAGRNVGGARRGQDRGAGEQGNARRRAGRW